MEQAPSVIWLTGISGAGKTAIANEIEIEFRRRGDRVCVLDGDQLRRGLNRDLGFSLLDRKECVRRTACVAALMVDAGLTVVVALISPIRAERDASRMLFQPGKFIEVFIDTPLEVAEERDSKGLYEMARSGELQEFTGIDSPYEAPIKPEVHIDTLRVSTVEAASKVVNFVSVTE
jgi:bifunctional enzyme CysN/CysC